MINLLNYLTFASTLRIPGHQDALAFQWLQRQRAYVKQVVLSFLVLSSQHRTQLFAFLQTTALNYLFQKALLSAGTGEKLICRYRLFFCTYFFYPVISYLSFTRINCIANIEKGFFNCFTAAQSAMIRQKYNLRHIFIIRYYLENNKRKLNRSETG